MKDPEHGGSIDRVQAIERMIQKYSAGLGDLPLASQDHGSGQDTVVLFTGTTGNLGAQILVDLLVTEKVKRVYTLNRHSSGSQTVVERHVERFRDKELDVGLIQSPKLIFLEGDTADEMLGLSKDVYEEVGIPHSHILTFNFLMQ